MTNKHSQLHKTFNLPELDELDDDEITNIDESNEYDSEEDDDDQGPSYEELNDRVSKLNQEIERYGAMTEISSDTISRYNDDVDKLHKLAKDGYEEVFSAALTLDPAQGSKFLAGAAKLLEIALRSKNSTMDKQIEMAKLQLQREKMLNERKTPTMTITPGDEDELPKGGRPGENGGVIYSRNELIRQRREANKSDDDSIDGDDVP